VIEEDNEDDEEVLQKDSSKISLYPKPIIIEKAVPTKDFALRPETFRAKMNKQYFL
jgi:hypothetical protein